MTTKGPPSPPADFATRSVPTVTIAAGVSVVRIHDHTKHPIWFGPAPGAPARNRFDDPNGKYRVCYMGKTLEAAFVEVFLRDVSITLLSRADLEERAATDLITTRGIKLIQFHGNGLHKLGATAEVLNGSYSISRPWGRACWAHPSKPDGIIYRARHDDDQFAIALFDRAEDAIAASAAPTLVTDLTELPALLVRYGVGLTD